MRRWRSVRLRAAVAGGIKCAQAYQPSTNGSAITFVRKNKLSLFMSLRQPAPRVDLKSELASAKASNQTRFELDQNTQKGASRGPLHYRPMSLKIGFLCDNLGIFCWVT